MVTMPLWPGFSPRGRKPVPQVLLVRRAFEPSPSSYDQSLGVCSSLEVSIRGDLGHVPVFIWFLELVLCSAGGSKNFSVTCSF